MNMVYPRLAMLMFPRHIQYSSFAVKMNMAGFWKKSEGMNACVVICCT